MTNQPVSITPGTDGITKASVEVVAGDLSASGFSDLVLGQINVGKVWEANTVATETPSITPSVKNFQGNSEAEWNISVAATGWESKNDSNVDAFNASNLKATVDDGSVIDINNAPQVLYSKIDSEGGERSLPTATFSLEIPKGTDVKAGSYTNTLTWSIANTIAADGE